MKTLPDLPYGPEPWMRFDLHLPEGKPRGTLLWFHGGGMENGTRKDILFAGDLADAGFAVASATYRLYPGAHYPEFIEDAALATAYFHANAARLGAVGPLFVTGQSAGAYLILMLALDRSWLARHGLAPEDFAGFVSDSAQPTAHFRVLVERGLDARLVRVDETAPLYFVDGRSAPPPLLLIHYADDVPGRPEQNRLLARTIRIFHPDADLTAVELPGTHSSGSLCRGSDGAFAFVKTFLDWARKKV